MRTVLLAPVAIALVAIALVALVGDGLPIELDIAVPVFLGLAVGVTVASILLPRLLTRVHSLRREVLAVALAAMLATGATIAVAAATTMMIVGPPQVLLLGIVAVMGAGFGIVVEYAVARDLSTDVRRLRLVAAKIAGGELGARSGVDRGDEIGQAARAIDLLATRLAALEEERSDSLAARQAFLTAVGHDLRTPLSALRAALDAIEDGLVADPDPYFAAMRTNIEAIRSLVDDLFLLSRIEEGSLDFERVMADVAELADEAVEALAPVAARRNVTIRADAEGPLIAPIGISEISRVIRNLLDNAIRHTPEGTEVTIALAREDGGVSVRVRDRGVGFEPELGERLFKGPVRVDRLPELGSGAGLGLVVVRGLVEAHGGRVSFEAGPGGTVLFWMPTML